MLYERQRIKNMIIVAWNLYKILAMKSQCFFFYLRHLKKIHHGLQTGSVAGIIEVFMDMSTTLRSPPYSIGVGEDSAVEYSVEEAGVNGIV